MNEQNGQQAVTGTNTQADMISAGEKLVQDTLRGACRKAMANLKETMVEVKAALANESVDASQLFDALMDADRDLRRAARA